MRRIVSLLCLLAAVLIPQSLPADPPDIAATARSVVRVVLIDTNDGSVALVSHGSGFAVGPDLVVTNAHVVAPMAESTTMRVGIVPSQGKSGYFAKLVAYSAKQDLALLRLTEKAKLVPAALFTGAVTDGEDVWAVGYPGVVDAAQGLTTDELMSPAAPVKTHGNVSAGRPGHGYETILHTAQLAAGNSGGPLLDSCGRVIGANSSGTNSNSGADSSYYFAVSMREISRFLLANGVKPAMTGEPCKSLEQFQSAQDQLQAGQQATIAENARAAAEKHSADLAAATRKAEQDVFDSRESHLALAGLALLLAVVAGGAAMWFGQQGKLQERKLASIGTAALIVGALIAWFTRPSISEIDSRAQEIAASSAPSAGASASAAPETGAMICVIDPQRSRITVSSTTDVPVNWSADGCVNGKTQYGLAADSWSRILAPHSEDTVSVAAYDPRTRTYRTDRYLLDTETMAKVREARSKYAPPLCGAGDAAARSLGESQAAVLALLPGQANERLVYHCSAPP